MWILPGNWETPDPKKPAAEGNTLQEAAPSSKAKASALLAKAKDEHSWSEELKKVSTECFTRTR